MQTWLKIVIGIKAKVKREPQNWSWQRKACEINFSKLTTREQARATEGAVIRLVSTEDEAKLNGISDQAPHLVEKWWLTEKVEKWKEIRLEQLNIWML